MASIQDVINAAYRIRQSANDLSTRTAVSANNLRDHSTKLMQSVRGSRTGEDAVHQVADAERAVRECALQLQKLQREIDNFIADAKR